MEEDANMNDLSEKQFGNLKVLYRAASNRQGSSTWVCLCNCGTEKVYSSDHLTRKKYPVKSCGCQMIKYGERHSQWTGCGEISGNWWYNHVLRERKQNTRERISVTVTVEQAWQLFLSQGRKCALTDLLLCFSKFSEHNTASLDRIDSSKGYDLTNVQWVHKDINFMKRTYSQEYFTNMCKRVASLQLKKFRDSIEL